MDNPGAQTFCDSYTLPEITGTDLSTTESYWTGSGGTGTQLLEGDAITASATIYIYDQNGTCSDEEQFEVTIDITPTLDVPAGVSACESYALGDIQGLDLSGNEAYYDNSQANGGGVLSGPLTGSQTVYIYDANGACSDEVSFEVTINSLPSVVSISTGGEYCEGDVVDNIFTEVSGVADYVLYYSLEGVSSSVSSTGTSIDMGNVAGVYVLDSLSDANCVNTSLGQSATIVVYTTPGAPTLYSDTTYCSNATAVAIEAEGTGDVTWYSDAGLTTEIGTSSSYVPVFSEAGVLVYYATLTENGCEGPESMVTITVEDCGIIVPTAFTPDNDGVHDVWELNNIDQVYPNNRVTVYNRWGNKLYESTEGDYDGRPWDGNYNGTPLPVASYYYVIEYNDGTTQNTQGNVSIIR